MLDLARRALNVAQLLGASYVDVRVMERTTEGIAVKNGRVDGISHETSSGFNVRVIVDGAWGFASSARMDQEEAERIARRAVQIARASAIVAGQPVYLSPLAPQKGNYRTPVQIDPFSVDLQRKVQLLLDADAAMRSVKGISLTSAMMEYSRERKLFVSSEGSEIEQELFDTGAAIEASAVDPHSNEIQTRSYPNSFGRQAGTAGYEFVEAMNLEQHGARIAEEAVRLLSAPQCPSGFTTIILDGPQVALQVHESCGHPIELDRVLGMEAGFVGKSFLTTDKLNGQYRYGSDLVNISADATIPGGLGTFGWDDEGVPAQHTNIVTNGIFTGYLMSRDTAPLVGMSSNGCVRADNWNRLPMIRMTNVSLEPGTWKLDDLIADTQDGLYLSINKSWSIDDQRLNFQFGVQVAYEIKHGKLGRLFKNATYTGITPQFWRSCDAICGPAEWTVWGTPNCGKGEPMQVMRTGHGAAPARFRNVQVGVGNWS
ncbi:TldD/PmbA family protein [Ktedonosporobacter rubrisoli]|uniref:TldD/PmbA family protein n=1 Tax=Ktedonosporobacter rubrisoli TaxID=2509675 RepID=A0A4P6JWY2_KTERU|nr:TldD/PmbA family protein [Ktedonosporobacter rubrisoli]QBD79870.1 TldD/PmbA family protein [Ktedonosporobacter rubrisoli]